VAMSLTAQFSNVKDDRIFSLSLPREASCSYLLVYDPDSGVSPTSKRIVQDVNWVMKAWWEILKAQGVYIPCLAGGCIAGGRHVATIERNALRGGKRIRMEYNLALDDQEMHADLHAVLDKHGGNITSHFVPNLFKTDGVQWRKNSKE
jgi:hypothetical protein